MSKQVDVADIVDVVVHPKASPNLTFILTLGHLV